MRNFAFGLLFAAFGLAQSPRFEKDIVPIFTANCYSCHGGTATLGLDLRTAVSALRGSHEGPVIVKGSAEKSLLFQKVSARLMPPPAFNLKLTDAQIDTIKRWIDSGAPSDEAESNAVRFKEQAARYEKEAVPVLRARCFACHASDKPMGGLDMRTLESLLRGGADGPVIEEGVADKSILIRRIASRSMPPAGAGAPVTEAELQTLRRWVDTTRFGARETAVERTTFTKAEAPEITEKDRQFWSFRKPVKAALPAVKGRARVRTPLDAFILVKLEAKGLGLSPDAPNLKLMRRAYFDLTGLPPSPKEADEFLADTRPGAYERLLDRLLASPHFGEKWGRHWLDSAGYSDAAGFDNCFPVVELFDGMWRYRDYVVRSFNNDKPYDRFVTEQLAGDELSDWRNASKYTPEMLDSLVATGYLRSVYDRTDADIVNLVGERYDVLFHLMEKVSTGLMGLTVGCARCHTHRYDPIPQRDYYRMMAVFMPAFNPANWKQPKNRFLADVAKPEEEAIKKHNEEIDRTVGELQKEMARLRKPYEDRLFAAKLAAISEPIRAETRAAVETAADKRDDVQKFLAAKFEKSVKVTAEEVEKALKDDDKAAASRLGARIKTYEGYKKTFERVQALWDIGPMPGARLLQRGVVESPGPKVKPGVLTVLSSSGGDIAKSPDAKGETTGQRLAFARWLTSRDHPLTARVYVNRAWQHLFGTGIVATPDNFGKMGAPPTHPELLDWLAVDFMENGWSVKHLLRTIMTSSVYRQSTKVAGPGEKTDPDNHLLWRMNMKRLEAEAIRDGVLSASGHLDPTVGGPPVKLKTRIDGLQDLVESDSTPNAKRRRSLYIMSRRNYPYHFLQVFDFPTIQVNCNRRSASATPLQSLALLNDEFMHEESSQMAARVAEVSAGKPTRQQIETAYRMILARTPDADELALAEKYLGKQEEVYRFANAAPEKASRTALASLCQMLASSNEFLYVD